MKHFLRHIETLFAGMGLMMVTLVTMAPIIEWAHSWDGTVVQPFTDRVPLAVVTLGAIGSMIWIVQGAYRMSFGIVLQRNAQRGKARGA